MMTNLKQPTHILLTLLFSLILVGCSQAAPIMIYVTPTPLPQIGPVDQPTDVQATPIPTVDTQAIAATATQPASITGGPTAVPTAIPDVTFVGAVIGPNYTLPPTSTPRPSATPTEGPSETPAPTSTEGPSPLAPPTDTQAAPVAAGTQLPTLDTSRMGIQLDPNLTNADWLNAVAGNVKDRLQFKWIKVQLSWDALQPNGASDFGEPFQLLEQHLQFANNNGFNILVSVARAPHWTRSNQNEAGPPDDPQRLADFLTLFVTRFPFVDAIEIWNEPNLQREWQGTLPFSGAGYMQLFRPAHDAIKALAPNIIVITAGLAPTGDSGGSRDDRAYLREMYANGLANYGDIAVGVHPYSWANGPDATCCGTRGWDDNRRFFFHDTMEDYRQIMTSAGQGNNQLWPTEFGWATWDSLPGAPPEQWVGWNDKWAQANYTLRAFQIGQSTPNIGPMFLWNLNFAMLGDLVAKGDERAAYSILVPLNPSERPLFWMLYDAVRPDVTLPKYD